MERALTSIERKAIFLKVGEKLKEFLVCAICKDNPGVEYENIDEVKSCGNKDMAKEKKKKLKREFAKDKIKILEVQFKIIE